MKPLKFGSAVFSRFYQVLVKASTAPTDAKVGRTWSFWQIPSALGMIRSVGWMGKWPNWGGRRNRIPVKCSRKILLQVQMCRTKKILHSFSSLEFLHLLFPSLLSCFSFPSTGSPVAAAPGWSHSSIPLLTISSLSKIPHFVALGAIQDSFIPW